ncbi:hypothetical protein HanIR_Chr15g0767641 [Helianthus annuus]|nr:hypothetical protein HanIR_Chr15g0767641 [Helianthus annuus]
MGSGQNVFGSERVRVGTAKGRNRLGSNRLWSEQVSGHMHRSYTRGTAKLSFIRNYFRSW